ncbi:spx domain-containing [Pyrenophora seminiperda CCB06]|uniref:Spx domain-containing n=1 Tax=Pyrenophora seminiperda CCB06 TaxID=1302712 RepID=A0A3M7M430_9PLEO|nr:spx domain-containing [Pyrenophora seminiperda CCB06]
MSRSRNSLLPPIDRSTPAIFTHFSGMKYGDTLRQRSIPEWGHCKLLTSLCYRERRLAANHWAHTDNIDYDYLKDLIKHQTTPGTNKAVSIPGQGESTERAFGDTFFKVLAEQHDRINLFHSGDVSEVRQWLSEHPSAKPIAGALSKRTRLTGLHNNTTGGIWATLDKDVYLKDTLHKDLEDDDWTSAARSESAKKFPHAILEIRREGNQAMSLIQTLDRTHLVERIRGFSLEAHAVWTCCKPVAMSEPFWTRKERLGLVHQAVVLSIAGAVVALDVVLLLWTLRI